MKSAIEEGKAAGLVSSELSLINMALEKEERKAAARVQLQIAVDSADIGIPRAAYLLEPPMNHHLAQRQNVKHYWL